MSISTRFSYHFFRVGQGLFSSGAIFRPNDNKPRFLWVYDCGTSSTESLIDEGIERLEDFVEDRKRIDLLTLSHFDHDHISGVVRLLRKFEVGTLLLPYMPLAQRLILAFEEGGGSLGDSLADFYVNPVEYLVAQDGPGLERILFILPSGGEGPAYFGEQVGPQNLGPEDGFNIQYRSAEQKHWNSDLSRKESGDATHVDFLASSSRITLACGLWEFILYNDDPEEKITEPFSKDVAEYRDKLLAGPQDPDRKAAMTRLKETYDEHFGTSSEKRNVISLFLYSGPIYQSWNTCCLERAISLSWSQPCWWRGWPFPEGRLWENCDANMEPECPRCSILYSGDGYLDTRDRLQKLIIYLDSRRVQRIGVFQVMHHGAKANWHPGVAGAIAPLFSVFSSDPERKKWKHPHAPVLRDFWRYGAAQVDKENDFTAYGYLK